MRVLSFELGDEALPILQKALEDLCGYRQWWAARTIAVIGGKSSRDILLRAYKDLGSEVVKYPQCIKLAEPHEPQEKVQYLLYQIKEWTPEHIKSALCLAMASTGTDEDVNFLIQAIEADPQARSIPVMSAAISLGILKAEKARPTLEKLAQIPDTRYAEAASHALEWMDKEPASSMDDHLSELDKIIYALISYGLPSIEEGVTCVGEELIWTFRDGRWVGRKPGKGENTKKLRKHPFQIHITKDGSRAMARGAGYYGPFDNSIYICVLRKESGQWKVVGLEELAIF
jgi:hypothetical protein